MLNQRLTEMKKALQNELKSVSNDKVSTSVNNTSRTKTNGYATVENNGPIIHETDQTVANNTAIVTDDVNFKYLKHVILKFLTSREVRDVQRSHKDTYSIEF